MQAQCALLTGSGQPLNKEENLHTANQTLINSSIKQYFHYLHCYQLIIVYK